MTRTLTITYDNSNEDGAALCVADDSIFFNTRIIKIFTGEKAEQLYKELTGQNVVVQVKSEDKESNPIYNDFMKKSEEYDPNWATKKNGFAIMNNAATDFIREFTKTGDEYKKGGKE
jgi:hypothetical protein